MYSIYCDGEVLWNPLLVEKAHTVLSPKLNTELNKAATLSFIMPRENEFYSTLKLLTSTITVYDDDEIIFVGRPISITRDWWNNKLVKCEDAVAWLNDYIVEPQTYSGTFQDFFTMLENGYNAQVAVDRRIHFTYYEYPTNPLTVTIEEYKPLLDMLWDDYMKVVPKGHILQPNYSTTPITIHIAAIAQFAGQRLLFGKNILDLQDLLDGTEIYTGILPTGSGDTPITIAPVNDGKKIYYDEDAVAIWGRIVKTVSFDTDNPATLLQMAKDELANGTKAAAQITIKGVDLFLMGDVSRRFRIGDSTEIVSPPHNYDERHILTRIELDMANPENSNYLFDETPKGLTEKVKGGST